MAGIFSKEATQAQIDSLPSEEAGIGVVAEGQNVGVAGSVSKRIGKGWTVKATGQWMKDTGAAVWGGITWKGKS